MHDVYPAHIRKIILENGNIEYDIQSVSDHCRKTAEYASAILKDIGLENTAYLAGLLHDMGKYTEKFKNYIEAAIINDESVKRGSINHTFAGVKFILEKHNHNNDITNYQITIEDIAYEIIAYAAGSHHGLFDCVDDLKKSGFQHRIDKEDIGYEEAVKNFFEYCASKEEVDKYIKKSIKEIEYVIVNINSLGDLSKGGDPDSEMYFYISMLCRLLTAAVISGDRRDTIEFDGNITLAKDTTEWNSIINHYTSYISKFTPKLRIDEARKWISDECAKVASNPKGVYRLNVPTGGGKTLASLRYSLVHVDKFSMKRIFFIMPLLSIIEQNAQEIRKAIGDDDLILEHHSNVINDGKENAEELCERELLTQSWDSPIVVTTLVQFLNTLFLGKTTSIRRFSALVNSVIVFDEVQTVPMRLLSIFNLAINFLVELCGATVILCSATQPCLEKTEYPLTNKVKNLIDIPENLYEFFKRTEIVNSGSKNYEELLDFSLDVLKKNDSLLIVCNTKSEAKEIFCRLNNRLADRDAIYHLSASMCTEHRKKLVSELKTRLTSNKLGKVVCVATQVIEAGVDVSFSSVIRLQAGMDNIIQAAGRCNRHGEKGDIGRVYIVRLVSEKLSMLPDIQIAKDSTSSLLEKAKIDKNLQNLTSNAAIEYYYQNLYCGLPKGFFDFPLKNEGTSILKLLAPKLNDMDEMVLPFFLSNKMKTAGMKFSVFDNNNFELLVPYKSGTDIINALESEQAKYDKGFVSQQIKSAAGYTIGIFKYQLEALEELNAVRYIEDFGIYILLNSEFYNDELGLDYSNADCPTYSW